MVLKISIGMVFLQREFGRVAKLLLAVYIKYGYNVREELALRRHNNMTPKQRLQQLADQVKVAGLSGQSMQKKMAEVIEANDLTSHDIQRIAEMANREVQLELYKTAADKRFKFELVNPEPLKQAAKKQANYIRPASDTEKLAEAVARNNGDPFAVPYRAEANLSVYNEPLEEKYASELTDADLRRTSQELDKVRLEYEALQTQGKTEIVKVAAEAQENFNRMVQTGMDHMMNGVTFASLYQAMRATVSGGNATEEDRKKVDDLALLMLEGLKERGFPNHRLGFKHRGNVAALDKLSSEEILQLGKAALGMEVPKDLSWHATKRADYTEGTIPADKRENINFLTNEAEEYMKHRPSVEDHPCPQPYLDDGMVNNLQSNGRPKVFNTDNQFVIKVQDLMGDQSRMVRLHSAQEYIGLKLQQIEDALRKIKTAQKTAAVGADLTLSKPGAVAPAVASVGKSAGEPPIVHSGDALPKPGLPVAATVTNPPKPPLRWHQVPREIISQAKQRPFEAALGMAVPLATVGIGLAQQHMQNKANQKYRVINKTMRDEERQKDEESQMRLIQARNSGTPQGGVTA